jgi:hypothetical protein
MPGFTRLAGAAGGTCGTTLTPAAGTCTINVVFQPTGPGLVNGTLTITGNVPVTNSPVNLSGTGVPPAVSITPNPLNINLAHNVNTGHRHGDIQEHSSGRRREHHDHQSNRIRRTVLRLLLQCRERAGYLHGQDTGAGRNVHSRRAIHQRICTSWGESCWYDPIHGQRG